jgi:putative ABC transport system permease protein
MRFVLRMLGREVRGSWTRLGIFFLSVGIGVAAIVVLRSVVQTVRETLTREARMLVGADIVVQSQRPLAGEVRARVDRVLDAAGARERTDVIETQTMARGPAQDEAARVRLVELRGVEAAFPYYGAIELASGTPYTHRLLEQHGAVVQPELLVALDAHVGDRIRLAGQDFTIRGVVTRDRVQRGGIAFGPRVYIDLADLRATSLLGFGSRATYQVLARVDEARVDEITDRLRTALKQDVVGVRSWHTLEDRLGENLSLAENYLALVGLAIVVLGGIGVWSVTRVLVQQKIPSVAILKCLGATSRQVLAVYLLQVLALAGIGSAVGLGVAMVTLALVPSRILQPLGVSGVSMTASAALQGVGVGLLVSLAFALVPLLDIRDVKPLRLLRRDAVDARRGPNWQSLGAAGIAAAAIALVAMWQAESIRTGLFVTVGLALVASCLAAASRGLVRLTRPLLGSRRFAVRHAIVSISRRGGQARVILMAVGLGCFFVMGVRALQANLLHELSTQVGEHSPDFVLIDIQEDQVEPVREAVAPFVREPARVMPLMRGRLVGIDSARTGTRTLEDIRREGRLTREFGLTFRDRLEANERVVSGAFWQDGLAAAPPGADTEVSVERVASTEGRIDTGDVLTFDIAGRRLRARVTSVRTVEWDDSQNGGFVFVLRPAPAVAAAAHTYVGFLRVHDDDASRGELQRTLVDAFPNVSAIDVREVLSAVRGVIENVTTAITIVGAVTLVGGGLILVGAVLMTRFQRLYDAAIYRTLGASTRLVAAMVAIEYGMLGLLAGALGAAGALALSWVLARYLFDIEWQPAPGMLVTGVAVTTVVVSVVGLAASWDVLVRKPLSTLRGE